MWDVEPPAKLVGISFSKGNGVKPAIRYHFTFQQFVDINIYPQYPSHNNLGIIRIIQVDQLQTDSQRFP